MTSLHRTFRKYLLLALTPVVLAVVGGFIFREFVVHAVLTSIALNGLIIGTAVAGVALVLMRWGAIRREWLAIARFEEGFSPAVVKQHEKQFAVLRLLDHLDRVRKPDSPLSIDQSHVQEALDDMHRVLESRQEPAQYTVGLLIALGLLGTFIGLLETLLAVGNLIGGFANVDPSANLDQELAKLVGNLKYPLTAMGTAFSASMFGLLFSLMLGLMMLPIRSFQTAFERHVRTVADEALASADLPEAGGVDVTDGLLWTHRVAELQNMQFALRGELSQCVRLCLSNEERQAKVLSGLEQAVDVAIRSDRKVNEIAESLSRLPSLVVAIEGAGKAAIRLIEDFRYEQREAGRQRDSLSKELLQQTLALAQQVDRTHAEQAKLAYQSLSELLDQRLSSIEAQTIRSYEAQRAAFAHLDAQDRMFSAFLEAGAASVSASRHLREASELQTQTLSSIKDILSRSSREAQLLADRIGASATSSPSESVEGILAHEIHTAADRIEREVRVGVSAILALQRKSLDQA